MSDSAFKELVGEYRRLAGGVEAARNYLVLKGSTDIERIAQIAIILDRSFQGAKKVLEQLKDIERIQKGIGDDASD